MANIRDYDPRHCERCGNAIDNGEEHGPAGGYHFLCKRCNYVLHLQDPKRNPVRKESI